MIQKILVGMLSVTDKDSPWIMDPFLLTYVNVRATYNNLGARSRPFTITSTLAAAEPLLSRTQKQQQHNDFIGIQRVQSLLILAMPPVSALVCQSGHSDDGIILSRHLSS